MTPLELSVLRELVDKAHAELVTLLATDTRGRSAALHVLFEFDCLIALLEDHK